VIADTERLIDGFRGLPAGMDGSKDPPLTPSEAAWYATNVTFRGGNGPKTRPGFREIPPTYWRNPQPIKSVDTITIDDGVATVKTSTNHGYDNKDKVIVEGATPSEVNGTHVVTTTGADTFTFKTSASGSVTGTITTRRDIDAAYADDFFDGETSRGRFIAIQGAILVQGAIVYQDPREGNPSQMIVVADGNIYTLNFEDASCFLLNPTDGISPDVPVYMTQAERFLVIQTGKDEPRVYDGYLLRRASYYGDQVIPIGKQMAYGQGRLFVAVNEGAEIVAGDLVFGGSTTNVAITSSSAANPAVITTAKDHGFVAGDQITIQGHSSSPPINSTYTVGTTSSTTTFTIPVAVTSAGKGGFVSRFNAGQDSDLLRFTENTFLNEGGSFAPTGKVGRITGLVFLPVQDTSTGQGDLIAFCERGAVTFQVSAPRDQWKNLQGFQRVLFDNIGSTSDSIIPVNGDLFFRSREGNGIRTYRNARAEADGYGQTPVSAEIDPVLKQDTQWMLDRVSFANFDNRLLMTCLPKQYPRRAATPESAAEFAEEPVPTLYDGIAVLDFQSVSTGRGKAAAVFDGVWTGLRIYKLVQGTFDGEPRCFAVCQHEDATGRRNEIWEVSRSDEYDTPVEGPRLINAGIVTRSYDFRDTMSLKKLLRCDLWFDDIGGGPDNLFTCSLAYRPDDYPNFTTWQTFQRNFVTEFRLVDKNLLAYTERIDDAAWTKTNATVTVDLVANPIGQVVDADKLVDSTANAAHSATATSPTLVSGGTYTFSVYAKADERDRIYLRMTSTGSAFSATKEAWFHLSGVAGTASNASSGTTARIEALDGGWYRCSITAVTNGAGTTDCVVGLAAAAGQTDFIGNDFDGVYIWGAQLEQASVASDYDPDPPQLMNYSRGYAPQVRFPTPPRTANLATDVPAYLGHDFTLRVNWAGHARLGRLMLHGQRVVEAVNGGTL
jgi:hypothetical protein